MTRHTILFAALLALLLFVAGDASAVNEGNYPTTLVDANCTDTEDTAGEFVFGSQFVQETGSADGLCDHDSRIIQAAITVDTNFGPLKLPVGTRCIVVWSDGDVVSNDTQSWRINLVTIRPHDGSFQAIAFGETNSTEADHDVSFCPGEYANPAASAITIGNKDVPVPRTFYIQLDMMSATSWAGSLSWWAY
jgi:hypothetical protein